ncbi:hypothetical protein [Heyndrickxia coagulans]|uniref:hypothetical protein n=1 Tax=Heyndrickxia coagulans TaxID=1398 RepID=UPI001A948DAC|nr:hypothetical protein [Heyndrickxia coagulans]
MKHNRTDEQILLQALETIHDETEKMREKEAKKFGLRFPFLSHCMPGFCDIQKMSYTKSENG